MSFNQLLSQTAAKKVFFLTLVSAVFYGHYSVFQIDNLLSSALNPSYDWPLLIDLLITLPLAYYLIFKPNIKQLLIKSLALFCLGIFIGSLIIPPEKQLVWPYLTQLRYIIIAGFVIVELTLLASLIQIIIKARGSDHNLEQEVESFVTKKISNQTLKELYLLEIRVWLYSLFINKKEQTFSGGHHFSYSKLHGNASNQQGFIFIILFELPIVHFIIHLAWSATAAYWITGLTLYGLIFMVADYKATLRRPISLSPEALTIRYGVWGNKTIPLCDIVKIESHQQTVSRSKTHLRFCQFGAPNLKISLKQGKGLSGIVGGQPKNSVYLGLDSPQSFLDTWEKIQHDRGVLDG